MDTARVDVDGWKYVFHAENTTKNDGVEDRYVNFL